MNVAEQLEPSFLFYTSLENSVALLCISSLLMMVYAPYWRWICLASTSSGGRVPSTRKSLIGCAQDGALTTTMTIACCGATASSSSVSCAYFISESVPELTITGPGLQSA